MTLPQPTRGGPCFVNNFQFELGMEIDLRRPIINMMGKQPTKIVGPPGAEGIRKSEAADLRVLSMSATSVVVKQVLPSIPVCPFAAGARQEQAAKR